MAKELRTAQELSDMIVSSLGKGEIEIQICKDHAYGWQPTVVASPGDLIGDQRRVEEIANRLRVQFALRERRPASQSTTNPPIMGMHSSRFRPQPAWERYLAVPEQNRAISSCLSSRPG